MWIVRPHRRWFGFGSTVYRLYHYNRYGRSLIDESYTREHLDEFAEMMNDLPSAA